MKKLETLEGELGEICCEMLTAGGEEIKKQLAALSNPFSGKVILTEPKKYKRNGGYYVAVTYEGKTRTGIAVYRAADVYDKGRKGGVYNSKRYSVTHGYPAQPKRPFWNKAIRAARPKATEAMQKIFDERTGRIVD